MAAAQAQSELSTCPQLIAVDRFINMEMGKICPQNPPKAQPNSLINQPKHRVVSIDRMLGPVAEAFLKIKEVQSILPPPQILKEALMKLT